VLVSCGNKCPGGGIGNAGECGFDPNNLLNLNVCKDTDCANDRIKAVSESKKWDCSC
jgi:hypothetical protein